MSEQTFDIDANLRILGTAHVSSASVELVKREIEQWKPDVVAVELCLSRLKTLKDPEIFDGQTLEKALKEGKGPLLLFQSLLAAEQRRLGLEHGERPGAEMMAAIEAAEEKGIEVALVDRDVQITLRRAWRKMGLREKARVIRALFADEDEDIDVDELLEDSDLINLLMDELREAAPGAGEALVDERDEYISRSIEDIRSKGKVLAILGAGHVEGVSKRLNTGTKVSSERMEEISIVPAKSRFWKGFKWVLPIAILGLVAYLASQGDYAALKDVALTWLALNALLAAAGAIAGFGHPLAILTAALASPLTSLNPTLAAGWFAGYVQLKVAKPTNRDLQDFLKLDRFSIFWKNRVGKVLLVASFTNLGSSLGAYLAGTAIIGALL